MQPAAIQECQKLTTAIITAVDKQQLAIKDLQESLTTYLQFLDQEINKLGAQIK